MADVTLNIRHNASQAAPAVGQLADEMGRMAKQSKSAATAGTAAANGFNKIGAASLNVGKSAKIGASGISKFTSSLGRIAFYRAIRSAIRYVTDSFKHGLEAAYNWSKEQGGANAKLAGAMDALSAASGRMKLQLGAAFGGLIVAIEPILIRIINLVTQAAEAITRFFAVLNGTGYYKKASEGFKEVGASAGGAGKKIKGLLASWDELNVIGKESGGGGGGSSATDYSGAYVWKPAESKLATAFLEGNLGEVGEIIGRQLREWGKKIDEWFGKYFGNDYDYWTPGLEGLVDLFSGILRGLGFDAAAYNLELFAEKVKAVFGIISEYANAFFEALENSKINIFFLNIEKFFTGLERDIKAALLSIATDMHNLIGYPNDKYIFKLDADVYNAEKELEKIDKKIEELKESGDNGVDIDAHVNHEKVDKYKKTLKKPWIAKIEVTEPKQKLGPEKFFSHGKKTATGYAYEIGATPKLEKQIDPLTIFGGGNNGRKNTGVYSTGNGLALTLGIVPQLGDRSKLTNQMDEYVARKNNPWSAFVDPIYNNGKKFNDDIKKWITGVIWKAPVNPTYNSAQGFFTDIKKYITGVIWGAPVNPNYNSDRSFRDSIKKHITEVIWKAPVNPNYNSDRSFRDSIKKYVTEVIWKAPVNPVYNSDKTFFETLERKITDKKFSTTVNPKLSIPRAYNDDMADLTEEKTIKIKPKLTGAKEFKEALQSALKASATIKTSVSGTTRTIGKVSMSEYAQGGWPNIGDLFIANEAGPELVGTIGGSTAVANNDDIVQGIQGGVERANAEQNELLRNIYSGVVKLLDKDITISPSVALGQVVARSTALYGRA